MAKTRHAPERSCVACGLKLPKQQLVRVVRTPNGMVMVDRGGKAAGRGAYLCWSAPCWRRGVEKGGLDHSLKLEISARDRAQLLAFYSEATTGLPTEER